jgi:hypothetical protein
MNTGLLGIAFSFVPFRAIGTDAFYILVFVIGFLIVRHDDASFMID